MMKIIYFLMSSLPIILTVLIARLPGQSVETMIYVGALLLVIATLIFYVYIHSSVRKGKLIEMTVSKPFKRSDSQDFKTFIMFIVLFGMIAIKGNLITMIVMYVFMLVVVVRMQYFFPNVLLLLAGINLYKDQSNSTYYLSKVDLGSYQFSNTTTLNMRAIKISNNLYFINKKGLVTK